MLEIYVILTLGALGYYMNTVQNRQNVKRSTHNSFNVNEEPSMNSIYDSNYHDTVKAIEEKHAKKAYNNPNTIGRDGIKSLTGKRISQEDFVHNNMVPYFGSRMRQNVNENANTNILENYTGIGKLQKNKCEAKAFGDVTKDNIFGTPVQTDYYKERIEMPKIRNNYLPFEQERVGPGLGQGFTSDPVGGFQQLEAQNYAQEKCVDELRVKDKPKVTYEGRVLDGIKEKLPGKVGTLKKNRVETFYEQTPDMYTGYGANITKQVVNPEFDAKLTNRQETTRDYAGTAYKNTARQTNPSVKPTARQQLDPYGIRNVLVKAFDKKDDYGRASVVIYNNERDLTTTKTYQGNLTSLVKSIIAPLEDLIRVTRKEESVDNPRLYGNLGPQMPGKVTVHDSADVAKTTIKETLLHDEMGMGAVKGPVQVYVYDPEEVAKTTIRNTIERMDYEMNLSSVLKQLPVKDPSDILRTTVKETTLDADRAGNIDSQKHGGGYETNEYDAPHTQKEFLSDIEFFGVSTRDKGQGYATQEWDAKQTQKALLSDHDYYGAAESSYTKEMSMEDYMNARIRDTKESTLGRREPVQEGAKEYNNTMNVFLKHDREEYADTFTVNNFGGHTETPSLNQQTFTKQRVDRNIDDRLDVGLLDALKDNPYARTLGAVA